MKILRELRAAVLLLLVLTLVTGLAYPAAVTLVGRLVFPDQAEGSVLTAGGRPVGSRLIGQPTTSPRYFHGRPSATTPPYATVASGASNLGPLNPALAEAVAARVQALRDEDPGNTAPIPVDLVTASGSGVDPHISPAAAEWQVDRVARARGVDPAAVRALVRQATQERTLGVLGEPRVNVLILNLALDQR